VAFIGAISNIHSLCTTYHWLAWVCTLPGVVVSLIQGFLPTVLLALLFMLVPIIMRILARLEGIPQKTGVELSLMDRFFLFQVIVRGHYNVICRFSNVKSERFPGCHLLFWNHRIPTWVSP
jgi:hypothetical protein